MARSLRDRWTLEALPDDRSGLGDQLCEILREEIDREILELALEERLRRVGWHRVPGWDHGSPAVLGERGDVAAWLRSRCLGRYHQLAGRVVFELNEDAVAFALVWT
jgi:hypothetical protein